MVRETSPLEVPKTLAHIGEALTSGNFRFSRDSGGYPRLTVPAPFDRGGGTDYQLTDQQFKDLTPFLNQKNEITEPQKIDGPDTGS